MTALVADPYALSPARCLSEGHDPAVIESYPCGPDRWTEILECRRCKRRVTRVTGRGKESRAQ